MAIGYGTLEHSDVEEQQGRAVYLFNGNHRDSRKAAWIVVPSCLILLVVAAIKANEGGQETALKYVSGRCIGGCEVNGPPLSLGSDAQSQPTRSSQIYQARLQFLDELPFDQVVQIGEHSIGKPFKDYSADEEGQAVMGKAYEDTPFKATLASTVTDNPARKWDFLDVDSEGGTLPKGY